jgi:hypothetical protein
MTDDEITGTARRLHARLHGAADHRRVDSLDGDMKAMNPRPLILILVLMLVAMGAVLTSAVARLENYRYANFVGACTEFDITRPQQRIERERCLEATQTRTHWFWHVLYGVGLL